MTDRAHLAFALALHRVVATEPTENACWSPFSVASALGLVASGAAGDTRAELARLLLGDADADVAALRELLGAAAELDRPLDRAEKPVLAVANTLWADLAIEIRDEFSSGLADWSGGAVRNAPFSAEPGKARDMINADVAETTRDLIPELVPDGAITAETVAAVVNALYLKCAWVNRFTADATRLRPFHGPHGTVEVPTMELSEQLDYAAVDGWQVVRLPGVGGVEAVVLLPDGELHTVEPELDDALLTRLLDAPRPAQVVLHLPSVNVSSQAELTDALVELGVRTMFTNDADFSGISPSALAVQSVIHEAVLKLDEEGLEGAAATAVMMRLLSMPLGDPVQVDVDRPFLLLVRHRDTGALYFVARVVRPELAGESGGRAAA